MTILALLVALFIATRLDHIVYIFVNVDSKIIIFMASDKLNKTLGIFGPQMAKAD